MEIIRYACHRFSIRNIANNLRVHMAWPSKTDSPPKKKKKMEKKRLKEKKLPNRISVNEGQMNKTNAVIIRFSIFFFSHFCFFLF